MLSVLNRTDSCGNRLSIKATLLAKINAEVHLYVYWFYCCVCVVRFLTMIVNSVVFNKLIDHKVVQYTSYAVVIKAHLTEASNFVILTFSGAFLKCLAKALRCCLALL